MSMLMMLKEGGGINIDSIGTKIDEDIDLLPEAGGTMSLSFRSIMEAISVTNTTSSKARAIVMGV
tara:strand:- start:2463 stop:2657 length:195 start_codon:yes stop_codon:yes gene_type:complete